MSKTRAYARVIFSGMLGVTSGRARSSIVTSSRTNEKERCQDSHCRILGGVKANRHLFERRPSTTRHRAHKIVHFESSSLEKYTNPQYELQHVH